MQRGDRCASPFAASSGSSSSWASWPGSWRSPSRRWPTTSVQTGAVSTWSMARLVCDYQAVYDPEGPGWNGCTLTLYEPPDGSCPSTESAKSYITAGARGRTFPSPCPKGATCDINLDDSIEGCNDGQPGCRAVEDIVNQPPATVG